MTSQTTDDPTSSTQSDETVTEVLTTTPLTTDASTGTTDSSDGTTIPREITTVDPEPQPVLRGFWNAITISMVVFLILIFIIIVAVTCYFIGKKRGEEDPEDPEIVFINVENQPKPFILPRISKVYLNTLRASKWLRKSFSGW